MYMIHTYMYTYMYTYIYIHIYIYIQVRCMLYTHCVCIPNWVFVVAPHPTPNEVFARP